MHFDAPAQNQDGFLRLNSLIEGESDVLTVIVGINEQIRDLKIAIQHARKNGIFKNVDAHDLALGMVDVDLETHDEEHLSNLKLEGIEKLQEWRRISGYWKDQPPYHHLHIIVKAPATASITPSSSNLSKNKPSWLDEMHETLWGKRKLFGKIFRTAKLTKADFIELQLELQRIDSSRSSPSYTARKVLDVKANFLRKKSDPMEFDILDSRLLVPSVSPVPVPVHDDAKNVDAHAEADPVPQFDNCRYIFDDAAELSMGSAAVFPCTIRYMDLTTLELKNLTRVPHLMLIRDEWDIMIEVFNRRERGIGGSAVFTGSPGIGKTCLLYYILILCLIRSQPVVFQDKHKDVFLITKTVLPQTRQVAVEGDDILTLVDADGKCCIPNKYILRHNLRILLTSPPRTRKDRKWLIQDIQDSSAAYIMSPWLQEEWFVASLFIAENDITLRRFWETADICGFVPRDFLSTVESPVTLEDARMKISEAITTCQDIKEVINSAGDLRFPHRAFVVYPGNEHRSLVGCLVEPISEYAMDAIIKVLDDRNAAAAFDLYESIKWSPHAATLRDRIWERKVHWYFRQIFTNLSLNDNSIRRTAPPKPLIIRSLDDNSMRDWDLSKVSVKHLDFGPLQMLAGELTRRVAAQESMYLQPTSDNSISLNSIIYQAPDSLVGIQITIASTHPIKTKGLSALQRSLKPKNKSELLCHLLPTVEKPWTVLFVVPKPMENSFVRQDITGADNAGWSKNIKQYVLGLDQRKVFRQRSLGQ